MKLMEHEAYFVESVMMSLVRDIENYLPKTISTSELPGNEILKQCTNLKLEELTLSLLITALSNRKLDLSVMLINLIEKENFNFELISNVIDKLKIEDAVVDRALGYADILYNSKLMNFPERYIKVLHSLDSDGESSYDDFSYESDD